MKRELPRRLHESWSGWVGTIACAAALLWCGGDVLAGMVDSAYCPATITFTQVITPQPGGGSVTTWNPNTSCSGNCQVGGQAGQCKPAATVASTGGNFDPIYEYKPDPTDPNNTLKGTWVPTGKFMKADSAVVTCQCEREVTEGTFVFQPSICCNVAKIPDNGQNSEGGVANDKSKPRVVKMGKCEDPNCDPMHPVCAVVGNAWEAEAVCKQ